MTEPVPALTDEELDFLTSMFDLAREGRTADLALCVDRGVPVNLTNAQGDSLLILAAYHGHAETVGALLERGADTERRNDRGQSALGGAVFKQHEDVVRALLAAGADPDGGTPSARGLADYFALERMAALLAESAQGPSDPPGDAPA